MNAVRYRCAVPGCQWSAEIRPNETLPGVLPGDNLHDVANRAYKEFQAKIERILGAHMTEHGVTLEDVLTWRALVGRMKD